MKARNSLAVMFACALLVLAIAVGCTKKVSDAQMIGEVATKIQADPNIQVKAIAVQAADGVVTLTGVVNSDTERAAAASDAGQVAGVRTVVNNLTVQQAGPAPAPEPVTEAPKPEATKSSARRSSSHITPGARGSRDNTPAPTDTVAQVTPAPASLPVTPPPPPKPTTVTIPDGTQIAIRLIDPLDSEKNQVGDRFHATLSHSIMVGDQVAIPSGADVEGRVIDVKDAGHFSGQSLLAVELTNVSSAGKHYEIHTEEYRRQGTARGKNTAEKVGGGAAVGAIIGAIAGGGKGAAIGATVGAGAGGGVQAATKGQQIRLPTESVLNFKLASPLTVTPNAGRHRENDPDRPVLEDRTNPGN